MTAAIDVRGVTKIYNPESNQPVKALDNVSLTINAFGTALPGFDWIEKSPLVDQLSHTQSVLDSGSTPKMSSFPLGVTFSVVLMAFVL